ncbi:hypothetical protein WI23_12040 [Burkholderia oklahomensis C6786]|nr:hypothetical protein WI23_12040 [Burkholderia oklahomensis C6786]KUY56268.1 hypothetical protein WI23_20340 [Burkholderia oklahomensis C6786]
MVFECADDCRIERRRLRAARERKGQRARRAHSGACARVSDRRSSVPSRGARAGRRVFGSSTRVRCGFGASAVRAGRRAMDASAAVAHRRFTAPNARPLSHAGHRSAATRRPHLRIAVCRMRTGRTCASVERKKAA